MRRMVVTSAILVFAWLVVPTLAQSSKSVSRVSRSTPGDTVKLDLEGLKGWAEL